MYTFRQRIEDKFPAKVKSIYNFNINGIHFQVIVTCGDPREFVKATDFNCSKNIFDPNDQGLVSDGVVNPNLISDKIKSKTGSTRDGDIKISNRFDVLDKLKHTIKHTIGSINKIKSPSLEKSSRKSCIIIPYPKSIYSRKIEVDVFVMSTQSSFLSSGKIY